jgi:hypothetical protein
MLTIKFLPSYIACHDSLDPLFQTLGIWIQGSRAAVHMSSATYFTNLWEDKDRRFKTHLTLSLILRVNLWLGGYSIWSASSITPHIKEDLRTTQGMSTSQPRCSQGSTRKTPSRWSLGELEDDVISTRKPVVFNYKELEGLSDPDPWDCAHGVHLVRPGPMGLCTWRTSYRIRGGTWPTLTPIATTRTVAELLEQ